MYRIFKDSISYLSAIYVSRLIYFIYKVIIAKMLGPKDFGLWSMLALILSYGSFLHLGLGYALVKEVPFYKGKEKWSDIEEIRNTVFTSVVIISTIAAFIILISSTYFSKYGNNLSFVISIIALILILQHIRNYFLFYFFGDKNFRAVSILIISLAFATLILAIFLIMKFNFIGLPFAIALGNLLVIIFVFIKYKPAIKLQINIKRFVSLLKIGLPIMMLVITYIIFFTIDRLLIFRYLGKENLGYYGIASALYGLLLLFPASLGGGIFPWLSQQYGVKGNAAELEKFIHPPTISLAYFMAALLGVIYLLLPIVVKALVPQYLPGINAGKIALMGIMFFSVSVFAQNLLIVINRQVYCLCIILSMLIFKIILIYIFINRQMGIAGVAMAGNIVYLLYSISIIILASYYCKSGFLESVKYLIKVYLPFIYLLLVLLSLNYFRQIPILNAGNGITQVSVTFIVLVIFVVVPFGFAIKKNLFSYLRNNP